MFGHLVILGHVMSSESFKFDTFCPLRVIVLCFLLLSGPAYKTTKSTGHRKELVASAPLAMPTVAWRLEDIGVFWVMISAHCWKFLFYKVRYFWGRFGGIVVSTRASHPIAPGSIPR